MKLLRLLCFLPIVLSSCQKLCDKGSPADLDIALGELTSLSDYKFKRQMCTEENTCRAVYQVMSQLKSMFTKELGSKIARLRTHVATVVESKVTRFPTVTDCVKRTYADVSEIFSKAGNSVSDCMEGPVAKFKKLGDEFRQDFRKFCDSERHGLDEIHNCFQLFTNCQKGQRSQCAANSMYVFDSEGGQIAAKHFGSPCMEVFKNVAGCVDDEAKRLDGVLEKYVDDVFECVEKNIDDPIIRNNIVRQKPENKDFILNSTLVSQIVDYNIQYEALNNEIDNILLGYYAKEREANQTNLFREKSEEMLNRPIKQELKIYRRQIENAASASSNVVYQQCASLANMAMDRVQVTYQDLSKRCNINMIESARLKIEGIRRDLRQLVVNLSLYRPSLLYCLGDGYLFKANSIERCTKLRRRHFDVNIKKQTVNTVNEAIALLEKHNATYFSQKTPLCEASDLEKLKLEADGILYTLERCIYEGTGNDEDVCIENPTTVQPVTITTNNADVEPGPISLNSRKRLIYPKVPQAVDSYFGIPTRK